MKNSDIMASIPTRDKMTVKRGAAGNAIVTLRSSICSKLTVKKSQILAGFKL